MKIKMTRTTIVAGKQCNVGDITDCSDRDGKYLIAIGKAEVAPKVVEKIVRKVALKKATKKGNK
jgi:hypothetical protein